MFPELSCKSFIYIFMILYFTAPKVSISARINIGVFKRLTFRPIPPSLDLNPLVDSQTGQVDSTDNVEKVDRTTAGTGSTLTTPADSNDDNNNNANRITSSRDDKESTTVTPHPINDSGQRPTSNSRPEAQWNNQTTMSVTDNDRLDPLLHHDNQSASGSGGDTATHASPNTGSPQFQMSTEDDAQVQVHTNVSRPPTLENNGPDSSSESPYCFSRDENSWKYNLTLPMCALLQRYNRCADPKHSCEGRCGMSADETGCSCLPICTVYKSCCIDYDQACPKQVGYEDELGVGNEDTECSSLVDATVIGKCPAVAVTPKPLEDDDPLVSACETPSASMWDIIPVTDSATGHQFKNLACWRCWKTTGEPLFWKARFYLDSRYGKTDEYSIASLYRFITENPRRGKWIPPDGYDIHACDNCAVSKCTGCRHPFYENFCKKTISLVVVSNVTYQNEYCYRCSSTGDAAAPCSLKFLDRYSDGHLAEDIDPGELMVVHLNASSDHLTLRQEESRSPNKFKWQQLKCHRGRDSVTTCQAATCLQPYFPVGGGCKTIPGKLLQFWVIGLIHVCVGFANSGSKPCKRLEEVSEKYNSTTSEFFMTRIGSNVQSKAMETLNIDVTLDYHNNQQSYYQIDFSFVLDTHSLSVQRNVCHNIPMAAIENWFGQVGSEVPPTRVCFGCPRPADGNYSSSPGIACTVHYSNQTSSAAASVALQPSMEPLVVWVVVALTTGGFSSTILLHP